MTDSDIVANGAHARKMSNVSGKIYEADINDMRLFNLDELSDETRTAINTFFHKYSDAEQFSARTVTPREILNDLNAAVAAGELDPKAVRGFFDILEESGFDGFFHDGRMFHGVEHNKHNAVTIFSKSKEKIKVGKGVQGNPDAVPRMTKEEYMQGVDYHNSPDKHISYDGKVIEEMDRLNKMSATDLTTAELKSASDDMINNLKAVEETAPNHVKKQIEDVREAVKEQQAKSEAVDEIAICFGGPV